MKAFKILLFVFTISFATNGFAQTVYTTKTGEKYHRGNCKYLKYSKKELKLDKAIQRGYEACKVCKPTANNTKTTAVANSLTSSTSNKTVTKNSTTTQCTGKTKAGKRCKRITKNASGRCYQH